VEGANTPIDDLLGHYSGQPGALIPLLQRVQERCGFLRPTHMEEIARALKLSPSEVYGVASFYAQFRMVPAGRTTVKVCRGTACHVRGSEKILKEMETALNCRAGSTSEDFSYSLEKIACFGACGLAPVVVIGSDVYGRLTPDKAKKLLAQHQEQQPGD
jgi:NADH-quinone oxidoreductase subunit E